jgi:hypothetical protein
MSGSRLLSDWPASEQPQFFDRRSSDDHGLELLALVNDRAANLVAGPSGLTAQLQGPRRQRVNVGLLNRIDGQHALRILQLNPGNFTALDADPLGILPDAGSH